jgi:ADP-ribosylglycohydrolase
MTEQQKDKIKGVFFGQAIGDALGLGTEFMTRNQIAEYYPNGLFDYFQIVQDKHRQRWKTGDWTDDTDQFLCICDSILKINNVNEVAFANELYKWYSGTPMGIGMTVYKVVSLPQFTQYPHKASELVWKISKQKLASNGAIMRTSIIGTYEFWDNEKVILNTEKIAKVTHWDPRCVGSCVIIASIIAEILNQNILLKAEQIIAIGEKYDSRIKPFIEMSMSNNISELYLDEQNSMGYTLKALSAGLWAYFNSYNFEIGILKVVNQGGDADTNACIAGSLLGAKFGFSSIPEKYINGLNNRAFLENKFNTFIEKLDEKLHAQQLPAKQVV